MGIDLILNRKIEDKIIARLQPNKVIILLGARRVGKTVLLEQLLKRLDEQALLLNGEDMIVHNQLALRSVQNYRNLIGSNRLVVIDEAQKIPEIGNILKLMVDEIEGLRIIITGSSALDLTSFMGEPLTGRKYTFELFPFSEEEIMKLESVHARPSGLEQRLIYGDYPELIHIPDNGDKRDYINELVSSYLLKDILAYENIRNPQKIFNLLRLVAFQIGGEVSIQELGNSLSMSKNTVEKYLDLLSRVFVIFRIGGFSRNLRKEITKTSRWYFYDNGIRNAIIANHNPIDFRADLGQLWENYMISERIKYLKNNGIRSNNFFWRTYDQQEIDWVEERDGNLFGFEFKWKSKAAKRPAQWTKAYPDAKFEVINSENYRAWLELYD